MGAKLNAFLAGIGGAFAIFPQASQFEQFVTRTSTQERMYQNFRRAGDHIRSATGKVASEQKERAEQPQRG